LHRPAGEQEEGKKIIKWADFFVSEDPKDVIFSGKGISHGPKET
jgi:hypothetical protein